MTVSIMVMIIIGIIMIILSFFVSEKLVKKEENFNIDLITVNDDYEFSERELRIIKRKIEDVIAKQARDILYETNESLSSMANEKTMALGDYAVAVCEEIEKNHKEVMFLYSMLDDKQKEIMKTVKIVDDMNREVKENLLKTEKQKKVFEMQEIAEKPSAVNQLTALQKIKENFPETLEDSPKRKHEKDTSNTDRIKSQKDSVSSLAKEAKPDAIDQTERILDEIQDDEFEDNANSNDIILDLYQNGSSILEIAKQLGLGVGEVKLVIDLYQGE